MKMPVVSEIKLPKLSTSTEVMLTQAVTTCFLAVASTLVQIGIESLFDAKVKLDKEVNKEAKKIGS